MSLRRRKGRKQFTVKAFVTHGYTSSVQVYLKLFTNYIRMVMTHFTAPTAALSLRKGISITGAEICS